MKNCLAMLLLLSFSGPIWAQNKATSVNFETQTITIALTPGAASAQWHEGD